MMAYKYIFAAVLCLFCLTANGQRKVSNSFAFENGLYRNFEEFKDNSPSVSWQDVTSDLVVMESVHRAKMQGLALENPIEKDSVVNKILDINDFWGFCVNGVPYMRVSEGKSGMHEFAGLRLRGRICYLEYQITVPKQVEVSAYNPRTGKPFRTAIVTREETVDIRQMIDFETGDEAPYDLGNVERWIASDKQLLDTFRDTPQREKVQKLFKFLQIFNDRNPVFVDN